MRRSISIVLCISLLLMTASCSSGTGTSETSASTSAPDTSMTSAPVTEASEQTEVTVSSDFKPDFTFTTTDRSGVTYTEQVFAGSKVTMINMWEAWCGPCIGEMPDLQKLYENYKDKGFNIIGLYSSSSSEEDVDEVLLSSGITYPILKYSSDFDMFQTGMVPTSFFVDGEGHIISTSSGAKQVIGANSYEDWESMVKMMLGEA